MATDTYDLTVPASAPDGSEPLHDAAGKHGISTLIAAATALVFLLVGAAGGMLITLSSTEHGATPAGGSVDVGFAQDMSVHHLQAVTMAGLARERSTDPAIRTLALDIESTQQGQVGMMAGWLALWGRPTLPTGPAMAWMSDPAVHGHGGTTGTAAPTGGRGIMPGMATVQELAKLRSLSGRELDVYFLQLVLRHHTGGVPMAAYAAERAGQDAVRTLADSILTSQSAEMQTITSMLVERGAHPLP
ncbi:FIG00995041: hypothetical protein [Alloactinosynnema sp. L-07]|uniref:DUF305 domain-containing protein n=1 Tax=Alloactinosynnema sp. L-07 TaxID=1653480 RepID=UPI00065EF5FF|nr:DUF305 domain-containing protein [Alloactinosynnema sp. L-07]CRK55266.1 FIG00995041: hypothetical protein [Alloactinosynnema sp. L-07]